MRDFIVDEMIPVFKHSILRQQFDVWEIRVGVG
jgi:hypothetical protein